MASSSGAGASGGSNSSGNPPLPLYYRGIPKDLGKKPEPAPQYTPKLDSFALNLMGNFNRKQKAAKEKRIAEEKARARAQQEEAKRKEEERRQESEVAARKLIAKSAGNSPGSSRRRGSFPSNFGASSKPKAGISKRRTSNGARGKRRKRGDDSDSDDYGYQPIRGMEIVKKKKKSVVNPKIRNTSDYSDLFGDSYLVGADVAATRELAKTSKAETERVRAADEKRIAEREKDREKGEEFDRIKNRMVRNGELKTRAGRERLRKLRDSYQARDYVLTGVNDGASGSKVPKTKKAQKEAESASIAEKKRALKARLAAMVSKPDYVKFGGDRKESRRSEPRPSQRPMKRSRGYSDEEEDMYEEERRPRRPLKKPKPKRTVYSDDDDFDDDSDDGGGRFQSAFAELEEEEEMSRKLGALEDKRELKADLKRKREKAARRRAAGLDSDDD